MANEKTVEIRLTKSQCNNLADFIDFYLIKAIREDEELDNLQWVKDMIDAHTVLREGGKYDGV